MNTSSGPRPPLPALGLPRPSRRLGPSALIALIVHVIVIGAVIWERTQYLQGAGRGEGPPGGGGGGGEQTQYVALAQAAEAPRQEAAPQPPPVEQPVPVPQTIKLPEPEAVEIQPVTINPVPVAVAGVGLGASGGPGEGAGSGGGSGGGAGTGTGVHDGPGTGGDGGDVKGPVLRGLIIAPDCVRGKVKVTFSVSADGKVADVDVDPLPKDAGCRRDLVTRMRQYKFSPAKTRDGRAVPSTYPVTIEH